MMSVVFSNVHDDKLKELTQNRTMASLPFGGRYRLIDFVLSNLVNSKVINIGIIAKSNYNSLMDHLGMGKDWDLNRKNGGLSVFPPFVLNSSRSVYRGKIEALAGIKQFIMHSKEEYILLCDSHIVCNINYQKVLEFHKESGSDITVICHKNNSVDSERLIVDVNDEGRITDVLISSAEHQSKLLMGMNMYILNKKLLEVLVEEAYSRNLVDFERDIIQKKINELKLMCYEFDGSIAVIDNIQNYFKENMRLLDPAIRDEFFYSNGTIFTKIKDSVPVTYGANAKVKNCLIADGCSINGEVENSIIFRGVCIDEGAVVKNSILMQNSHILSNAQLSHVITDKNVVIREWRMLSGFETYPVVIAKNNIV